MKRAILVTMLAAFSLSVAYAEEPSKNTIIVPDPAVTAAKEWQKSGRAKPIPGKDGLITYPYGKSHSR